MALPAGMGLYWTAPFHGAGGPGRPTGGAQLEGAGSARLVLTPGKPSKGEGVNYGMHLRVHYLKGSTLGVRPRDLLG